MKNDYQVYVGNIGKVYEGHNHKIANGYFKYYVKMSQARYGGRAKGEQVNLFKNDEILLSY